MKRDMELIRAILVQIEERSETNMDDLMPEPTARYGYHVKMLIDEGFLDGVDASSMAGPNWAVP